ncbi:MAG: glycosyltransferase family 39 protein, partial [Planctomycetaceae bacterium]|nr:glycosyltransferase family 39 protein [Planctomycetaceae bacterium]
MTLYGLTGIAPASTLLLRSFHPLWATLVIFRSPFIAILIIIISAVTTLLPGLGTAPLWDEDEPKNAACTLAMLDSGDWIVPTYNGSLRVEKPPLVNWVQIVGISLFGRNEFGVRIGSACLTIGTCLLTWWIGRLLAGPFAGLLSGLVMSTCIWTAVGGRAATPDASLVFCTTMAGAIYVHAIQRSSVLQITRMHAIGIGLACGFAILAKGPVGIVLPMMAFALTAGVLHSKSIFTSYKFWICSVATSLRPLTILAVATAVALPWYVLVGLRTNGEWIRDFLLVHNAGRFMAPMEGHSGSFLYYPMILAIGLFPWSIILLAVPAHAVFLWRTNRLTSSHFRAVTFSGSWALTWIGTFAIAGTKLPGYIWPAYPAISVITALYIADWLRGRTGWEKLIFRSMTSEKAADLVMNIGWLALAAVGICLTTSIPLVLQKIAPGNEWLGLLGLLPIIAAAAAFLLQRRGHAGLAIGALTTFSILFVATLGGLVSVRLARHQGTSTLLATLSPSAREGNWASIKTPRPSLVFYTQKNVDKLESISASIEHLRTNPSAKLVVEADELPAILPHIPAGFGILCEKPGSIDMGLAIIGRIDTENTHSLA